ncbi:MAG: nucleotidyltransferase family protein [Gemmatimonadaceae bacterium]
MALTSLQSLLSPEARLLLLTAGGSGNDAAIAAAVRQPLDWSKLSWLAEWERATGVVWRRLHAVSPREIPPDVALGWERLTMVADFHALYLQERFLTTVRALTDEGIEVILLKGAALAHSAYASFTDRPMGDVDLLARSGPRRRCVAYRNIVRLELGSDDVSGGLVPGPPSALTDPRRVGAKLELHRAGEFWPPFALGFDAGPTRLQAPARRRS